MDANFLSPKTCVRADPTGWGTYAAQAIEAGETVAAFGGRCVTRAALDELPNDDEVRTIQIDDDLFLIADHDQSCDGADVTISHSCTPNCGIAGVLVIAMRDVAVGERLAFDYAMCTGSSVNEFECHCGAENCRHKVTGHDWMLPELQIAYRGYFSPYLAKRIAALISTGAERRPFAY